MKTNASNGLALAALTVLLGACGGGGGGDSSSTTSSSTTTFFNLMLTSFVTYTDASKSAISSVSNGTANYPSGLITTGDLFGNFTMKNDANTIAASFAGVSQAAVAYSVLPTTGSDYFGMVGTSFQYGRAGQYIDYTSIHATQTKITDAGFYIYKGSPMSTPIPATYANAGKAIGMYASATSADTFECDVSVALTTSGTTQTATITPSSCVSNTGSGTTLPTSGQVVIVRTPVPTTVSATGYTHATTSTMSLTVGPTGSQAPLSYTSKRGEFVVVGPAGEEMVGVIQLSNPSTAQPFALLNFAAKK